MKYNTIGTLRLSRIGLGAMGMSAYYTMGENNEDESIRTIHRAIELGINLIDTAEIYGPYTNEELVEKAINGKRDKVVLATKFGLISHTNNEANELNSKPTNIRAAVEGSLRRLKTDYIDLYYQHRVDPNTPIEETISTLADLISEGKIRHIGLSEAGVETIRRAHTVYPLTALQTEYSLWERSLETEILPVLRELDIGLIPYSPLGRGFLTGKITNAKQIDDDDFRKHNPRFSAENIAKNLSIIKEVESIANELNATPAQIALAWLLAQGNDICPIPGTKRVKRLEENALADTIELNENQLNRLDNLSPTAGERYDKSLMGWIEQ